ncbi:MAG: hypothetical protein IKT76_07875, partial [Bacteroides sp.]|nr:hypothetical protein [Bacteroides sp.]
MKKILLLTLLFLTACSHQPKDYYEIFGEVENVKDSTIITLFRRIGNLGQGIASDTIIDGKNISVNPTSTAGAADVA